MVRLDDEERREAPVFEKPGRVLFARGRKHWREWRMEIRRQFRDFNRESENALSRFEKRRCQWCFPFRNVGRQATE